ncbi:hypothetical protein SAMN04489762_3405 [Terribacillus saccharophilus]|uniref:Conjugal transfer protein TrbL n=1 Tax=Terribacillus saccharophilus TaxID=361277 RepID=A0AAX2EJP2_9BACI|nr:hypothetical protein SAMN04489762_3405 [Terribacillus saccharophilus]
MGFLDWASDKVGSKFQEVIEETVTGWVEDVMEWSLDWMVKLAYNLPENEFVKEVLDYLGGLTSIFAVVLVLYKIIEYIVNTQNGTQQYPLDEILLRTVKSAGAIMILPWILQKLFVDISLPIAEDFVGMTTKDFDPTKTLTVVGALLGGGGIVLILVGIFFLVVFIAFLYSLCIFYADFVVMMILTGPVALSLIADDNNYFQVWWRELLSMVTAMLIKVFLVTLIINIIFAKQPPEADLPATLLLAVGAGALIIKTPSVLKNMWYGGGSAQGVHRGTGRMGSMASSMLMQKMIGKLK